MDAITISLLVLLIVFAIIIISILLFKKSKGGNSGIDKKDLDLSSLQIQEYINKSLNESNNKLNEFEKGVIEKFNILGNTSKENIESVQKSLRDLVTTQIKETRDDAEAKAKELRLIMNEVNLKAARISDVKDKVNRLDNLLSQNNKAGKAGEYLLERMMKNIVGMNKHTNILFEEQYKMKKKSDEGKELIVDLFIKGHDGKFTNIPIDAKFPFNNYEKLSRYDPETGPYSEAFKNFLSDVKKRIDETSKYISDEDGTTYAIMFIPSEGIFNFVVSETSLIDDAFKKNVIIAGPSTMMAIIKSVDQYMRLFDDINNSEKKIKMLGKVIDYLNNYDKAFSDLLNGVDKLAKLKNELATKEQTLLKHYNKLLKEEGME